MLCLTKADLASPDELLAAYADLDVTVVVTRRDRPPDALRELLADRGLGAGRPFRRRQIHAGQRAGPGRGAAHR